MNAVLDASAAVEVVLGRPAADRVTAILSEAETVWAPELFTFEITNLFWKLSTLGGFPVARCQRALSQALQLPDAWVPGADLVEEVLELACQLRRPAYDLFYLVLARRHAAILLTMDRKLSETAKNLGVHTESPPEHDSGA